MSSEHRASPTISGAATAEGTRRYARRQSEARQVAQDAYRELGESGLVVSKVGFGGYRVDEHSTGHRRALRAAIAGGVNLIDTSTNYGDGGSERLVGEVLREAIDAGEVLRDELVVVSKVGYVQGSVLEDVRASVGVDKGGRYPDLVRYSDDCWHCLHPDFLRDGAELTRERIGLERVDVYLLHNPEYYLLDLFERRLLRDDDAIAEARESFYDRMRGAFVALERLVADGLIGCYGVSSNTLAAPESDPVSVSLTRLLDAARAAAVEVQGEARGEGRPSFRVVELPLNVIEDEGARAIADGEVPVVIAARDAGLAVLVNRPLNAVRNGQLVRLARRPFREDRDLDEAVEWAVARLLKAERALMERLPYALRRPDVGRWVAAHWRAIGSREQLDSALERRLLPRLGDAVRNGLALTQSAERDAVRSAADRVFAALRHATAAMTERLNAVAAHALAPWEAKLNRALPVAVHSESVARRALLFSASVDGVSSALNGMRTTAYVEDAFAVMAAERE